MHKRSLSSLAVLYFLLLLQASSVAGEPKHRGMSWVAGPEVDAEDLAVLEQHHVSWIVQTPFGWQAAPDSPEVKLITSDRVFWGERDLGIERTTQLARERGIKTLLKPHVWLRGGGWRGDIAMKSEAEWDRWFATYRTFILHYARLAQRLEIEALAIGTELHQTVLQRPAAWRDLIAEIRELYDGKLTYSANWYREFEDVSFWGELDYIGIQVYFPLSSRIRPPLQEIEQGWQPHLQAIEAVHRGCGRPVLFTEIGYKSTPDTAVEPWTWPEQGRGLEVDLQAQADAYQAFFDVVWDQPWFAGAYIWKWFPKAGAGKVDGKDNILFTPQGKPALQVLRKYFARAAAAETAAKDRR